MAQAEGGTAGDSSSHGNGSMGGGNGGPGGGLGGGLGGSNGGNGGGAGNQSDGASSAGPSSSMSGALSASAPASDNKQSGGIMGGLMSSVQSARDSGSAPTGGVGGFSNTAGGRAASAASAAASAPAAGQVSNAIGAMNTPEARDKAQQMGVASRQGYAAEANKGLTQAAFGVGGMPGALAGKAIGAAMMSNPYGKDTDEANSFSAGGKLASQQGLNSIASTGANLLGGVLGGPIGGMLMNALTSAASYGMQRAYSPSAFDSSVTPGVASTTGAGPGANFSAGGNGGLAAPTPQNMAGALSTPAPASAFQAAGDYDRGSYQNLGLENII